jgi:hypothetical protein
MNDFFLPAQFPSQPDVFSAKPASGKGSVVTLFEHNNKFPPTFSPAPVPSEGNVFLR